MFINFTGEQLSSAGGFPQNNPLFYDFTDEYRRVFIPDISLTEKLAEAVNRADPQITRQNVAILTDNITKMGEKLKGLFPENELPDTIFFIGPGNWDGHGIMVKGKAYTFFDMTLLNRIMENPGFKKEVHNLHEMIHALHYSLNRNFYPGNYDSVKDEFFNKMWAEGIASYLSMKITGAKLSEALCFGFLENEEFNEWIERCEELKDDFHKSIKDSIRKDSIDQEAYNRLFFMCGETISCGRYGYYYGFEAVKRTAHISGDESLLAMTCDEVAKSIEIFGG